MSTSYRKQHLFGARVLRRSESARHRRRDSACSGQGDMVAIDIEKLALRPEDRTLCSRAQDIQRVDETDLRETERIELDIGLLR